MKRQTQQREYRVTFQLTQEDGFGRDLSSTKSIEVPAKNSVEAEKKAVDILLRSKPSGAAYECILIELI